MKNEVFKYISRRKHQAYPFDVLEAGITYTDPNYEMYDAHREFFVIEYVESGEGTVSEDGTVYYPQKGDLYILTKGTEQHYYSSKKNPWTKLWLNIDGPFCNNLLELYEIPPKTLFKDFKAPELFYDFFELCDKTKDANEIVEAAAVLFLKALQQISKDNKTDTNIPIAKQVKQYIDEHVHDKLTAEFLANKYNFSYSHLSRLFKERYNQPIYTYILNTKILAAQKMLYETNMPIADISDQLNFPDSHYFCNVFKKKTNQTPLKYRKSSRLEKIVTE